MTTYHTRYQCRLCRAVFTTSKLQSLGDAQSYLEVLRNSAPTGMHVIHLCQRDALGIADLIGVEPVNEGEM